MDEENGFQTRPRSPRMDSQRLRHGPLTLVPCRTGFSTTRIKTCCIFPKPFYSNSFTIIWVTKAHECFKSSHNKAQVREIAHIMNISVFFKVSIFDNSNTVRKHMFNAFELFSNRQKWIHIEKDTDVHNLGTFSDPNICM